MSDAFAAPKVEWVQRVLGVTLGSRTHDWSKLRMIWQQASEAADAQIAALQGALRESDDDVLQEIGEFGLSGVTGNFRVPLMAGLRELDRTASSGGAAKLLATIQRFRAHIESSEKIRACDDNPFGVAVSLQDTLGKALAQMESDIARAA